MSPDFVRYRDDLERPQPDEARTFAQLARVMQGYSEAFHTR